MHVIGTAGHVDHGKSTLVQALTGIDPDRLAEEKAREMTIDLGFAWLELDGQEVGTLEVGTLEVGTLEVGIVDVPGHRDFIENMLAGVGGIDLALFVIAADEGVMPQTREHLAILDLLEVDHAVIALTKCDLIEDPDWLELVQLEVNDAVQGTALAGAPIIPVSARSGVGIDELRNALSQALQQLDEPMDWGRPRLPIDRVFSLSGFGTIVTGTLLDGSLRLGDEIEVQPGGRVARIRGLQTHKTKRDVALPGSRVAINLTGLDKDELGRGQVVARKGQLRPTRLLDVLYRHLPDADAPLAHNAQVKLFAGSAEVLARARIIAAEEIGPGQEGFVQFALDAPIAAVRGERFIVRRPSPGSTLGGGRVLDAFPGRRHRRFRDDVALRFRMLAQGSPLELLMTTLIRLGPLARATLLEKAGLNSDEGKAHLDELIEQGEIVDLDKVVIAAATWNGLKERSSLELRHYHQEFPLRPGIQRETLRGRLQIAPAVFNPLREALAQEGAIVETDNHLRLPSHEVRFTDEQEQAIARLMDAFREHGILSPSVKEAKALVGEDVYFALVDLGRLKPVNDEVVYAAELYEQLIRQLSDHLHDKGSISAPEARDLLGTSRKYAIALLEHMDELQITRRSGDQRLPARPQAPKIFTQS